jgi:S-adenosylmethionine-diacylglycerol 3-amino-3-carboxypropyl transferase
MTKATDIQYANCWEDADILLQSSGITEGQSCLSIASGGDNTLALLTQQPGYVLAVDSNQAQLFLFALKIEAFKRLEYPEILSFWGVNHHHNRGALFQKLASYLPQDCRSFWEQHRQAIQHGILHCGKFEHYFTLFRKRILPLIHSTATTRELLQTKTAEQQHAFYHHHWNTMSWRIFTRIFFSRTLMGWLGRKKSYLKEVTIPVSDFIIGQYNQHLTLPDCQDNYFLHYILTGTFGPKLPVYLREEHFDTIRNHIDKVELAHGYIDAFITQKNRWDFCNLSNIFEYMNVPAFHAFQEKLYPSLSDKASICYWNLMVQRELSHHFPDRFNRMPPPDIPDMGFFYRSFIHDQKR